MNKMKIQHKKHYFLGIILVLIISFVLYEKGFLFTSKTHTILLTNDGFEPNTLFIKKGDTVTFQTTRLEPFWPASDLHPAHDAYPEFDSQRPLNQNESWQFKFEKKGNWGLHDHLNSFSRGKIHVQ